MQNILFFFFIYKHSTESQVNPKSAKTLKLRDASMLNLTRIQNYLRSPVLNAGRKIRGPGVKLQKQAWTGNQIHMSATTMNCTHAGLIDAK